MDSFFRGQIWVHMGVVFQKNTLPTLQQFVRVKKTHQPHVHTELNFASLIAKFSMRLDLKTWWKSVWSMNVRREIYALPL